MRPVLIVHFLVGILLLKTTVFAKDKPATKINGISVIGSKNVVEEDSFDPICSVNTNWVCLIPYAFTSGGPKLYFDLNWQWWGETTKGITTVAQYANDNGLEIMLKP